MSVQSSDCRIVVGVSHVACLVRTSSRVRPVCEIVRLSIIEFSSDVEDYDTSFALSGTGSLILRHQLSCRRGVSLTLYYAMWEISISEK